MSNNGYEKQFIDGITAALKPQIKAELAARDEAKAKLAELETKRAELTAKIQGLIREHTELSETADSAADIERLNKLSADMTTYRDLLARSEGKYEEAAESLRKAREAVDSKVKYIMPKVHAALQEEIQVVIDDLADRLNGYTQAVSKVVSLDIGIGFMSRGKPWQSLSIKRLADYV